jgi:hypothetical protein
LLWGKGDIAILLGWGKGDIAILLGWGKGDIAILLGALDNLGKGPLIDELVMPRTARSGSGGYTYHVLNRGNGRATVFPQPDDHEAFVDMMAEAAVRAPRRVLGACPSIRLSVT